ncbi:LOW QUALITY PROTEIN: bcl-2-like protein 1 [Bombina bombina]|uniref:LOW QUALITY PROTEIN: bcl-2-like protein 1 n=1 Tax=Bombina bombina TaxID=8345 RepID=UPI00235A9697|nr:LOW QUALITY PROTEIN: bcl-2-like protein 1 [Bombina bombina]
MLDLAHGCFLVLTMLGDTTDLVQNFVCHKLSQKGFSWSCCRDPVPEALSNGTSREPAASTEQGVQNTVEHHVQLALQDASEEFELRYQRAFCDLTSQLHITQDTAYQSFEQVVGELFRDGINWGRIVAFFSFGGALCVESANKEMKTLLPMIVQWMSAYLDTHLAPWIQEHGGWETFVSLYGNNAAAESRKSQESFGRWLLTGVTLAGLVLFASYISRR